MIHLWILRKLQCLFLFRTVKENFLLLVTENFLLVPVHKIVEGLYLPMHLVLEMTLFLLVPDQEIVLPIPGTIQVIDPVHMMVYHHQYLLIDRDHVTAEGLYLLMHPDLEMILIVLGQIIDIPMKMPIGHNRTRILIR